MNNKVYRLLRNNKEQGPFTADELIQKNLKPFDLIWADGRSAAWSYPTEMAEFKMYVPDADKKVIVSNIKVSPATQISASVQAAVSVNDIIKTELPKQKPRYKVSAAWSKIQTIVPAYKDVMVAEPKKVSSARIIDNPKVQPVNAKPLSWEQAWLDYEHEKNSIAPVKPVNTQTSATKQIKVEPVLEKKFEQSLDTITNNYINSLLHQKKKSKSINLGKASEFVLPSLALIIIFSIAYWFMHDTKIAAMPNGLPANNQAIVTDQNKQTSSDIKASTSRNDQTKSIETPVQKVNNNADHLNEGVKKEQVTEHYISSTKYVEPVKTNNENSIADNNVSQTKTSNITDVDLKKTRPATKQFDPSVINNVPKDNTYNDAPTSNNTDLNANENRPVKRRTNVDAIANDQTAANNSAIKNSNTNSGINYVNVPEYIAMNDGSGTIKVQNISDVDLDLAVVDVMYYDASGRFRKGETLYLHNLKAGKSVNIKTAKDAGAAYATSKISLVSSDANGVYAVGDN